MFSFSGTFIIAVAASIALSIFEYFLTIKQWQLGVILPVAALITALIFDLIILWTTVILLIVFVVAILLIKRRDDQQKEINKMNIQDLE